MPELLLELLSEEIPARMQARAAEDLKRLVCFELRDRGLSFSTAECFCTPRRLTVYVDGLPEHQPDQHENFKGPRVDAPAKALEGFFKAHSTSAENCKILETTKGNFFFYQQIIRGKETKRVLPRVIDVAIDRLKWPKSMRWNVFDLYYVRPLHNVLALYDGNVLEYDCDLIRSVETVNLPTAHNSLRATNRSRGHRFLAPAEFEVRDFADYAAKLYEARVMLDPAERRALIASGVRRIAATEGLDWREDAGLLDEVTGLVEWPVPMVGSIDPAFMDVPAEVLVTAMRSHQKYFSLVDAEGRLAPRFVLVANTEAADGGAAIVAGNERVLRARLSDAKFFWDEDRKRTLESRVPKLAERVFHAKLGSDLQRSERLAALARTLAPFCGADPDLAARAAGLCKADLTSAMVGEFPELQGIMGRYYAQHDAEPAAVADAIGEHYSPQGPSDRCPAAPVTIAVSLADKFDTLSGFFAIGELPTGSRDPYALRRAALGVIRIVLENKLRLDLRPMFARSLEFYPATIVDGRHEKIARDLLAFLADRLKVHLREQGVRHDLIAAVFAGGEDDFVRLLSRVEALRVFLDSEDGANLLVAYRRASNIVRIEENKDNRHYEGDVDETLLTETQEAELHRRLGDAREGIARAVSQEQFGEAMAILAGLRAPVDDFFEHVQVNCANAQLRINRLELLSQIRSALGGVADFSLIEG